MADIETFDVTNPEKPTIKKDPNDILDYSWDFSDWLADIGDTISTKSFVVDPSLTVVSSQILSSKVIAFVSGGTLGKTVFATCEIVTAGGRTKDKTLYFKMKAR